jgi:uncharacterized protein (DUF58 family)
MLKNTLHKITKKNVVVEDAVSRYKKIIQIATKIQYHNFQIQNHAQANKGKVLPNASGMNFKEVRSYAYGDDIRLLDHNTSARYNEPFVKVYEELNEPQACIAIDVSASLLHPNGSKEKTVFVNTLATALGHLLTIHNVQCSVIFFSDKIEHIIPGTSNPMLSKLIFNFINNYKQLHYKTDFRKLFAYLQNQLHVFTEIYLISDGWDSSMLKSFDNTLNANDQGLKEIAALTRHLADLHSLTFLKVCMPYDRVMPNLGIVTIEDPETKTLRTIDTSHSYWQRIYKERFTQHENWWQKNIKNARSSAIGIDSTLPFELPLNVFFKHRAHIYGR